MFLAENLQYLRTSKKMSQADLAEYLNTTCGAVSMWERKKRIPDIETIVKIAGFFEVSLDDLILKRLRPQISLIAHNIRFLQERYGLSDRDIALISAASSKTVKGMLKSLVERQEGVERIAVYFGITLDQLMNQDLSKEETQQIIEKYLSERS